MNEAKLVFLDTETTGTETGQKAVTRVDGSIWPGGDRINQLAFMSTNSVPNANGVLSIIDMFDEMCNPHLPNSIEASVATGITDEMLIDKPDFSELKGGKHFQELNIPENVFIAHNSPFDIAMVEKEGIKITMQVIDTCRVLRHLYPDLARHTMQYFRYYKKLYLLEPEAVIAAGKEISAHDALGDVIVLKLLFEFLLKEGHTVEEMISLTKQNVLLEKWKFGKYVGRNIVESAKEDPGYIFWNLDFQRNSESPNGDLIYTLSKVVDDLQLYTSVRVPFGKYKGLFVYEVAASDLGWLEWVLNTNEKKIGDGEKPFDPGLVAAADYYLNVE